MKSRSCELKNIAYREKKLVFIQKCNVSRMTKVCPIVSIECRIQSRVITLFLHYFLAQKKIEILKKLFLFKNKNLFQFYFILNCMLAHAIQYMK